jgi:hypothetical protein
MKKQGDIVPKYVSKPDKTGCEACDRCESACGKGCVTSRIRRITGSRVKCTKLIGSNSYFVPCDKDGREIPATKGNTQKVTHNE